MAVILGNNQMYHSWFTFDTDPVVNIDGILWQALAEMGRLVTRDMKKDCVARRFAGLAHEETDSWKTNSQHWEARFLITLNDGADIQIVH